MTDVNQMVSLLVLLHKTETLLLLLKLWKKISKLSLMLDKMLNFHKLNQLLIESNNTKISSKNLQLKIS
jgi:hypothetical protein